VHLFERGHRKKKVYANVVGIEDPDLEELIGMSSFSALLLSMWSNVAPWMLCRR
jgi:hypothetical protein